MLNEDLMKTKAKGQGEQALNGIRLVLELSDVDADLLWYVVEWYYGVNMHPDTDVRIMQSMVSRIGKEITKNISE